MKKLYLSRDKRVCGVCGGLGEFFGIDPVIIRALYLSLGLVTAVVPFLIAYIVMALVFPPAPENYVPANSYKTIKKSSNKKLAGVCGGLGEYFGIDPTVVRLIFLLFVFLLGGGIVTYIVCACMFPSDDPFKAQ